MKHLFSFLFLFLFAAVALAQAPHAINYQGVARNNNGAPYANQQVSIRISVRAGLPDGTVEYSETRTVTTNQFGLFSIQIGSAGASNVQGSFSNVNWSDANKYLQTEISVSGQPFVNIGTTQMVSVPFAISSQQAKHLKFPFDTTVSISNGYPVFNIRNTGSISTSIFQGESVNGLAFSGASDNYTAIRSYTKAKKMAGVEGIANADSAYGIYGAVHFSNKDGVAVYGDGSLNNNGVRGKSVNKAGVQGYSEKNYGVYGQSKDFDAVAGISTNSSGVYGSSVNNIGVIGFTDQGDGAVYGGAGFFASKKQFGVMGEATGNSVGVLAKNNTSTSLALSVEGKMKIAGYGQAPAAGKVLTSDASGNATWQYPQTIAFRSSGIVNNGNQNVPSTEWSEVRFYQVPKYNFGEAYEGSSSKFTVPEKGIYHFDVQVEWVDNTRWNGIRIIRNKNGAITALANDLSEEEGSYVNYGYSVFNRASVDFLLDKGDVIYVEAYSHMGNRIKGADSRTFFNGHLVMRVQ